MHGQVEARVNVMPSEGTISSVGHHGEAEYMHVPAGMGAEMSDGNSTSP